MQELDEDYQLRLYEEVRVLLAEVVQNKHQVAFLTLEDRIKLCEAPDFQVGTFKKDLIGYPCTPLVHHVANFLVLIMCTGTCPINKQPDFDMIDEGNYPGQRTIVISSVRFQLQGALTLWKHWNREEKKNMFANVLEKLRFRGLLDLLQVRRPVDTVEIIPLSRHRLIELCEKPYLGFNDKTMCGFAMARHAVKNPNLWWGTVGASEEERAEKALNVVNRILDETYWISTHSGPGRQIGLLIRTIEGYGLYFYCDPPFFIFFLESFQEQAELTRYKY